MTIGTNWILILTGLSLFLFMVEILLVPGVGVVGVAATICLFAATYFAGVQYGGAVALSIFFGIGALVSLVFYVFLKSPMSNFFILKSTPQNSAAIKDELQAGLTGICRTDLRPSGKVAFVRDGKEKVYDVVTAGEFLDKETFVQITLVEGSRIVVAKKS